MRARYENKIKHCHKCTNLTCRGRTVRDLGFVHEESSQYLLGGRNGHLRGEMIHEQITP